MDNKTAEALSLLIMRINSQFKRLWSEHPSPRTREVDEDYLVDPSNFEPRFYRWTE